MKKRTKSKFHLTSILIVLLCMSGTVFFAYLFYKDLNTFTVRTDKQPIGIISDSRRVIQRKFDDRVVWERVSQNAELYNADTIRTSDLSHSVIRFKDNTVLDIFENTMIQIFYDENQGLHISVDDGGIIVDSSEATSEAHVKFDDGSVVQIDAGSSLSAQADTGKNSKNVEIKSGTAQITTEAGDEMALVVGESVNVSQSGRILKNPLTVMSPQKELRLLNTSNSDFTNINFEWKNEYESPVIIQTSRLKNFSKLESDDFIETGTSYTLKAPNDTLYWRVFTMYTIDSPVTGKIIIDNDTQMQLVSPVFGTSYRYYTEVPRIKFRWTGNENAAHYKIAISSTSDMKSILTEKEVQETPMPVPNLPANDFMIKNHVLVKYIGTAQNVSIPETVTEIDAYAFFNCVYITSLVIPDSIAFLGEKVFFECANLKTVSVPAGIEFMGNTFPPGARILCRMPERKSTVRKTVLTFAPLTESEIKKLQTL